MSGIGVEAVLPKYSVFPSRPYEGQTFVHEITGRKIEYTYENGLWVPKEGFGPITMYVDPAGVDSPNYGAGPGVDALKTIDYAWKQIPHFCDKVSIQVGAGIFADALMFIGKYVKITAAPIEITGTTTTLLSGVATGGAIGAGANPTRVTGIFVAGAYDNKLIHFTSGVNNDLYRIISLTTATTLWLNGQPLNAAPVNGDTYEILDWASIISGEHHVYLNQTAIRFNKIKWSMAPTAYELLIWGGSEATVLNSLIYNSGGNGFAFTVATESQVFMENSLVQAAAGLPYCVEVEDYGHFEPIGVKILGANLVNGQGLRVRRSYLNCFDGCELSGFAWGAYAMEGSEACFEAPHGVTSFIHGNTIGIRAQQHSGCSNTQAAHITFGTKLDGGADPNTGSNTSADAVSFSWIGT
jgi:hypothetical protein